MAVLKRKNTRLPLFLFLLGPIICLAFPNLTQITTDKAQDYHVKWSPDGKTLAFTSTRAGNLDIWVKDASSF